MEESRCRELAMKKIIKVVTQQPYPFLIKGKSTSFWACFLFFPPRPISSLLLLTLVRLRFGPKSIRRSRAGSQTIFSQFPPWCASPPTIRNPATEITQPCLPAPRDFLQAFRLFPILVLASFFLTPLLVFLL